MITQEQVLEALRDVEDPEIHRSIVEMDMVRNIHIDGNHIGVEVLLTITNCPLRTTIENSVKAKLLGLEGVTSADVKIGNMTDEERARFAAKLRGKSEPTAPSPLLAPDNKTQFLAIASGKGGVGKSTVTANLARALASRGIRVGIIDADIYGFSIPAIFGLKNQRPTVIDDIIIPLEVDGVKIMSMGFFVQENSPVVWRGPMLGKMLRNFFDEAHWGDIDVMLLDLPPGTGDVAMDVHQLLPKSKEIIVTTPHPGAADVAVRAGMMALRTNHEIVGVVESMSYFACEKCGERTYLFGKGGGERVASALKAAVLAQIPLANQEDGEGALFGEGTMQGEVFGELAKQVAEKLSLTAVTSGV